MYQSLALISYRPSFKCPYGISEFAIFCEFIEGIHFRNIKQDIIRVNLNIEPSNNSSDRRECVLVAITAVSWQNLSRPVHMDPS